MDSPNVIDRQAVKPDKDTYMLLLAFAARTRADCLGRRVGAVLARDGRVLSTGYNGTPFGMPNCSTGGCYRCSQRHGDPSKQGGSYDVCLCVHAEQNALLTAARYGQQTMGSTLITTLQPCFGCLKQMLQAGVEACYFFDTWNPLDAHDDPVFADQYDALAAHFSEFKRIGDAAFSPSALFAAYVTP